MNKLFSCRRQHTHSLDHHNHIPQLRGICAICKISRLFHYEVTCYYKHVHSLCFSTQMQPCGDTVHTHQSISQGRVSKTAVVHEEAWRSFSFTTRQLIHVYRHSCVPFRLKRLSKCDNKKNQKAISWLNFSRLLCNTLDTGLTWFLVYTFI